MTQDDHIESGLDPAAAAPSAGDAAPVPPTPVPPAPVAAPAPPGDAGASVGSPPAVQAPAAQTPPASEPSFLKDAPWGAIVVICGLIAIVIIFVFAIEHYKQASNVATATASVSGVIAALVGAYFGIRGSSLAQEKAQNANLASGSHPIK
jgi:hypothetical protein